MLQAFHQIFNRNFILDKTCGDGATVENNDAVYHGIDMENVVIDEYRTLSSLLDGADKVQGLLGLRELQTHGWFVQDDDLCVEIQSPCDRNTLFLTAGHRHDGVFGVHSIRGEPHVLTHESR